MNVHAYGPVLAVAIGIAALSALVADEGPGHDGAEPPSLVTAAGLGWTPSDVQVSDPATQFPGDIKALYEPSIAIDPTDPDTMLVFALDFSVQNHDPDQYSVARGYRTIDGGATWEDLGVVDYDPSSDDVHDGGDPVVVFDDDGVAYLATLGYFPEGVGTSVYLHRSIDGGATWEIASVPVPPLVDEDTNTCANPDKEWLSIDRTTGTLYLTYTMFAERCEPLDPVLGLDNLVPTDVAVYFTSSTDGGETWSEAQRIWAGWALGSVPKVAPDGTIHVATWTSIPLPESPCPTALGVVAARQAFNAIMVATSTDDGDTWSYHVQGVCTTIELADAIHPGRVIGGNVNPTLAIDPVSGHAYVAYPELRPTELRYATMMIATTDGGSTWAEPSLVTPGPHDALLPTMVADEGLLHLAYVETRDDGTADTYHISSADGGTTWSTPTQLSSASGQLGLYPDIGPYRDPHTGDYNAIDLVADRIAVVWSDARDVGDVQIYVRTGVIP